MGMILGLDLGTNSIGWALYDNDNQSIIELLKNKTKIKEQNTGREIYKNLWKNFAVNQIEKEKKIKKILELSHDNVNLTEDIDQQIVIKIFIF